MNPDSVLTQIRALQERLSDEADAARLLRAILDVIPANVVVTDMQGTIREVNAFACEALGYTREELIGLHPWDIDAEWDPARVAGTLKALEQEGRFRTDGRQRRKDGSSFPVEVHLRAIELASGERAVVGVSMDQTERQEMARLRVEHAQAIASHEALASVSGLVHYEYDFLRDQAVFGGPVAELTGLTGLDEPGSVERWVALLLPADRPRFQAVFEECLRPGGSNHFVADYRLRTPAGQVRYLEDRGRIVRSGDGRPTHALGFLIDRTEQRELERRLQHSERLEAVGRLAGGVCHDFNNLLTAILGFSELSLGQLPAGSPAREWIQQVLAAAKQARSITGQLLAFTCLQQDGAAEVVDLGTLTSELETLLARLAGERARLEVSCTRPAPSVLADPGQLQRVVLNLVLNARDAMPQGGTVRLGVARATLQEPLPLEPTPLEPGDYAVLTVTDEGHGIQPEVLPHVFEPYFTTKPRGQGSGLGLATVYGVVRQARGGISVESEVDRGTRVTIWLPEAPPRGEAAPPTPRHRALVVEDDPVIRELIAGRLLAEGWEVLTAEDGTRALALDLGREPLDLVISDVQLPGASGPEVVAHLRRERPGLAVLFISGYPAADFRLPPDATFLRKPFGLEELSEKLRPLVGGAPGA